MNAGGGCLLLIAASTSVMRLRRQLATMEYWQKYREMLEKTIPPSENLVDRDALLSYISGLLKSASLIPTTCEVLHVAHTYSSVEEVERVHMSLNPISTLVTDEEKPLLLKDVAEYAAKLWAEKDSGYSPFRLPMFLVRAYKPRP
ncbi:unnamed protein product [Ixodes hexagonus]